MITNLCILKVNIEKNFKNKFSHICVPPAAKVPLKLLGNFVIYWQPKLNHFCINACLKSKFWLHINIFKKILVTVVLFIFHCTYILCCNLVSLNQRSVDWLWTAKRLPESWSHIVMRQAEWFLRTSVKIVIIISQKCRFL